MSIQGASTARFLDREASTQYLQEWTAHVAAVKDFVEAGIKSILIFRIGMEWLALSTTVLQEVDGPTVVRSLPDNRGGILKGLVNVRGELLLCVALEPLLRTDGGSSRDTKNRDRLIICGNSAGRFAFQVSEVEGVSRYHPKDLRDAPATLSKSAAGSFILGVLPREDKTIGCLDHELLFFALNKGLA